MIAKLKQALGTRGPSRWSMPTAFATISTSPPVSSQRVAISLMKLIFVANKAFAAIFDISADSTSITTTGPSTPACSSPISRAVSASEDPITTRSGARKSSTARPSAVNSGFDAYPTCPRPARSSAARTRAPVPTGTVDFTTTARRCPAPASESTTDHTRDRSASPAADGGVSTQT